jgi:multidrug resistance efflux pump
MNYRSQLALLLGVVMLLATSGTSFSQTPANDQSLPSPAAGGLPEAGASYGRTITVDNAQIVCIHKIPVAAQADGIIDQLLVDEGYTVKKGDTLLVIDNRVATAELGVAQKELEASQKQAVQTAELEYATKASEVSDAEYEDIYKLYNQGSATYSEARRKQLEKERARLGIDVAKVKHEQEVLAADVAKEKVNAAQVRLELYKVTAPWDGLIVQRLRDQGEWIRSGEPVLRLVHMNEMKVETYIPVEGLSLAELKGAPMKISVRISPQQVATYTPTVEFVSPEIESRRVRISTRIQNEMLNGAWLLSDGMTAAVEIVVPN